MKFPFFKKKADPAVSPETDQYYTGAREERAGVAWVLALGTLLITLGVALGLFFGGRWLYRKVVQNGGENTAQPQTPQAPVTVETSPEQDVPAPPQLQGSQTTPPTNTQTPSQPSSQIPRTGPEGPESEL